ncbi:MULTISPECIES: hypothetical protein [Salinibaculum]|uniref:hypothetical protein n=1 Tax=Salinibaculum TaxID=2732368 RepID=UPI0030CA9031
MTAIRSVASLRYGMRLFGYLFAVLVVGGGLLALGYEVGYDAATTFVGDWSLSAVEDTSDLAAGGILALLGSFVLLSGVFGVLHKLVADSVAVGLAESTPATVTGQTQPAPGADAAAGSADEESEEPAVESEDTVEMEASHEEPTESEPAPPAEPSEPAGPSTPAQERSESPTRAATRGTEPGDRAPDNATPAEGVDTPPEPQSGASETAADERESTDRAQAQAASETGGADITERGPEADEAPAETDPSLSEIFDENAEGERVQQEAEEQTRRGQPPEPPEPPATQGRRDQSKPSASGTEPVPEPDANREETPTDPADEWESKEPQSKREPTPEEIAFGTSGGMDDGTTDDGTIDDGTIDDETEVDDATEEDTDGEWRDDPDSTEDAEWEEEDASGDGESGRTVGNASGTDPLADPDGE